MGVYRRRVTLPAVLLACVLTFCRRLTTEAKKPRNRAQRSLQATTGENDGLGPPARIAYFLLVGAASDVEQLATLLPVLYAPQHWYVLHLDIRASPETRSALVALLTATAGGTPDQQGIFGDAHRNIQLLRNPSAVSWGGLSVVLATLHGMGAALHLSADWDYLINLSTAHLPLLRPEELASVLRVPRASNTSFVQGQQLLHAGTSREEAGLLRLRAMGFHEDERLFVRYSQWRPHMALNINGLRPVRPLPALFDVWHGPLWCVLHRSFAEYVHRSPDNVARLLLNYFAAYKIPEEAYFQTTACHPNRPSTPPVANASLHYTTPLERTVNPEAGAIRFTVNSIRPSRMNPSKAWDALGSGHIFAARFGHEGASARAAAVVTSALASPVNGPARMERALRRLQAALPLCPQHRLREVPLPSMPARRPAVRTTRKPPPPPPPPLPVPVVPPQPQQESKAETKAAPATLTSGSTSSGPEEETEEPADSEIAEAHAAAAAAAAAAEAAAVESAAESLDTTLPDNPRG